MTPRRSRRRPTTPDNSLPAADRSTTKSRFTKSSSSSPSSVSPNSIKTPGSLSPDWARKRFGPLLLPKIRKQDQTIDFGSPHPDSHCITAEEKTGAPRNLHVPNQRTHSSISSEHNLPTPVSARTSVSASQEDPSPDTPDTRRFHLRQLRPNDPFRDEDHNQADTDQAVLDAALPHDYHQPLYEFQYSAPPFTSFIESSLEDPITEDPSFNSHHVNLPVTFVVPGVYELHRSITPTHQHSPLPSAHSPLASELIFEAYEAMPPSTTLLDYLTIKNPTPDLIKDGSMYDRLNVTDFWWDIRNLRPWKEFNIDAINRIDGISKLLSMDLPAPALPLPRIVESLPDTVAALHDMYSDRFGTMITAALKASTGIPHLVIFAQKPNPSPGAPKQVPDFVARYPPLSLTEQAIPYTGDPSIRVAGIVRAYETWNSGMRSSDITDRINFLRVLAQLHGYMRAHGCRYGFILNEVELVCVRMGSKTGVPHYGFLELAEPVPLAAQGRAEQKAERPPPSPSGVAMPLPSTASRTSSRPPSTAQKQQLTVVLALWYLHLLSKDVALPSQPSYAIHIGSPNECTRHTHLPRDKEWIGEIRPHDREKRDAKRARGWVWPDEPVTKKEAGAKRGGRKPKRVDDTRAE